jgi:hypothetical protein
MALETCVALTVRDDRRNIAAGHAVTPQAFRWLVRGRHSGVDREKVSLGELPRPV